MDLAQLPAQCRVGIAQIDREHLRLFELLASVQQALEGSNDSAQAAARDAVAQLIDYTRTHFSSEEALMMAADYPGLSEHREMHADLLRQVTDMALRTDIGDPSSLLDISSFLNRWLVTHIQGEDQKFGRFAAEN